MTSKSSTNIFELSEDSVDGYSASGCTVDDDSDDDDSATASLGSGSCSNTNLHTSGPPSGLLLLPSEPTLPGPQPTACGWQDA